MPAASRPPQERDIRRAADRYMAAALEGDAFGARLVVDEALHAGWPVGLVHSAVLAESMRRIGEAWHAGTVSVAHEHRASELTLAEMERIRRSAPRGRPNGLTAIVAAVAGERHSLGARMAADLLYLNGWEVDFLGADTPADDLARLCEERAADVVVLSATVEESVASIRTAIEALGRARPRPLVIVGGQAAAGAARSGSLNGHDAVAESVDDVPRLARALVAQAEPQELDDLLAALGARIQALRVERGWNQKQLAEAAGLDRTYLSALENGRQNVSLGALKKIADALGVGTAALIGAGA